MKVILAKDYNDASAIGGQIFKDEISVNPNAVLGLATGSTPIGIYDFLSRACQEGKISFRNIKTVNLDEYIGLEPTHDQSYRYFMMENLFGKVDIKEENIEFPRGTAADTVAECARYNKILSERQIDVQLLGIGPNGHIGFNEPGTPFDSTVHTVSLTRETIDANARFFSSEADVPRRAITMGISNIMSAKKLILVATGTNKAEAVYAMLKNPISPECPASVLRLHGDAVVIVDEEAAKLL